MIYYDIIDVVLQNLGVLSSKDGLIRVEYNPKNRTYSVLLMPKEGKVRKKVIHQTKNSVDAATLFVDQVNKI